MLSFPFQLSYGKEDVMYSIMWHLNCIFYVTTNWPLGKITCSDALGIRRFKHSCSVVNVAVLIESMLNSDECLCDTP